MHDYATSVLAFAAAARLAVHRGDLKEADRQLTRAMRARPSCTFALPFLAVRVRLQLAKVHWAIGDHATARHLLREIDDVLLHRPALGALVDEVAEFRRVLTSAQAERGRRVTPDPGGASAAALPADAPDDPRDRRAAVRLPQHRQHRGRLDLPETRGLVPQRRGATRRRRSGCSADSRHHSAGLVFQGVVEVVAERQRQLRRRRDHARQPHDGMTPTSTSTISAAVAPALTAESAWAP